ncbi:unnamed protein product [Acanthoscelides obtectus]|uniref:Uncharacterized protein n=1 Tax=Acanthoscelides obtectus TaxID=200917 RepID=A0A9P0JTA8_ACAOB|nr:unnamed protein product [Acanthoscelides obtectus]CAK1647838.1 hypothetical protein AOBTE_LOCUS15425 [Acanthoscelides obtectus]
MIDFLRKFSLTYNIYLLPTLSEETLKFLLWRNRKAVSWMYNHLPFTFDLITKNLNNDHSASLFIT